jgi:hypothetical protein
MPASAQFIANHCKSAAKFPKATLLLYLIWHHFFPEFGLAYWNFDKIAARSASGVGWLREAWIAASTDADDGEHDKMRLFI